MLIQDLITSILAFASTNIDDIFILTLFYGSTKIRSSTIIVGQYVGISTLFVVSLLASYIGNFIDQRYIGILGVFPIFLAIRHVMALLKSSREQDEAVDVKAATVWAVAGVTIANGADNIGVYVPLLTTMTTVAKIQMAAVFLVMTYGWCWVGKYLASRPMVARQLETYGHVIMPLVLFLLGVFILLESNTFDLLIE